MTLHLSRLLKASAFCLLCVLPSAVNRFSALPDDGESALGLGVVRSGSGRSAIESIGGRAV